VSTDNLKNTFILLIGFAGTGKYTIGRELCRRTGAKLIDNHLINNVSLKSPLESSNAVLNEVNLIRIASGP